MDIHSIMSFLGISILLTLMPGPDNLCVLTQSISKGKNAGMALLLGLCTGIIVHITAATVGISAIIYQSSLAFTLIKYAGAAYLLFLAYKTFREGDLDLNDNTERSVIEVSFKSIYRRGIIMNLLNPKVSLFFLAFLPQFVDNSTSDVTEQMLIYGFLFFLQTLLIFSLMNIFAGQLGAYLRKNPVISKKISHLQGTLFAFIGVKIAFSEK
ncbi:MULTISPECIES: LysE family translocator [Pelosinus]|uniref:Lysine exporter protein (LYSE/YGGA) n=1 Tax=Pelosinus fermentans B4 TaxID=1149862 RepID=I9LEI1_9FIRM|nr:MULTISPECIES: LysE family translocator [Pelosinus]EIW18771.1 Lysine exporter protein (LYSE/YGGA) [Pelosinus fermentans B4]EIW22019.1 Lysine exporter protein (LYSE/YGGA) [Pelosinus fermentans A11]OAM95129.1 Lysine exporter protein (LYSE/YGGA) [Pelosinus fermentans DSM 17108]SDR23711.1 Threonine/homoserine/homoserine lactone efflux protein [Pelosinus fermentans]